MIELIEANWDREVIESKVPVLVEFYSPWCKPCLSMLRILSELEKEFTGKLKIAKVDLDLSERLGLIHKISLIPTFKVFKSGKVVKAWHGATGEQELKNKIEEILKSLSEDK